MDSHDNKMNGHMDEAIKENGHSNKGNEDKKIFVGGIAYDVTNDDLSSHFSQYGEVTQAQVKFDRTTGRSRGFAFVEFATGEGCKAALAAREQTIKNKQVEVKPAKSRENKKVFVGGLPSDYNESDLRLHFETYGKVEDIEWPFDKMTKARRNFAFIVFEEEQAADLASAQVKQTFGSRECDVKKAVPQGRRFPGGLGRGGIRPYGRGANNTAAWYNNWAAQMHAALPYGAWGDWYGNSFAYQQNGNTAGYGAGYPTAASNGGNSYQEAYQQNGNTRQNGNAPQRYPQVAQTQY